MKKLYTTYGVTVLLMTVITLILMNVNVPYVIALIYLLPMSITIMIFEAIRLDSIFSLLFLNALIASLIYALIFIPILFAQRFKSSKAVFFIELAALLAYLILSHIIFSLTGSWSSV